MNKHLRLQRRSQEFILGILLTGFLYGCAGSASTEDSSAKSFTANLGTATVLDINQKARLLLERYQFQIVRYESTVDALYFETEWKPRYPFDDEIGQGIEETRTRIIIQATPRTRSALGSDLNTVRMEAENQVRLKNGVDWRYAEMSKMLRAYLRKFADDLSTEFRVGLRRY